MQTCRLMSFRLVSSLYSELSARRSGIRLVDCGKRPGSGGRIMADTTGGEAVECMPFSSVVLSQSSRLPLRDGACYVADNASFTK